MSRKKKKKQKQLQQKPMEQTSLNGWSCPSVEQVEDDADDVEYMEQDAAQSVPVIEVIADPIVEPIVERVYLHTSPVDMEVTLEEMQPEDSLPEEHLQQEVLFEEPSFAEALSEEPLQEEIQSGSVPGEALSEQVRNIGTRLGERISGLIKAAGAPRVQRTHEEVEEDEVKFGGLEDEEPQEEKLSALRVKMELYRGAITKKMSRAVKPTEETALMYDDAKKSLNIFGNITENLAELNHWAFEECYYIGVLLIRNCSDLRRLIFKGGVWLKYTIPPFFERKRIQLVRMVDKLTDSCLAPFHDITVKTRSMRYRLSKRGEGDESGQKVSAATIIVRYIYSLGRPVNHIANFLLPILGCAVLAATVLYFQQVNYALEVEYDGMKLGFVESESDFYEAQSLVYQRMLNEEYTPTGDSRPSFNLVIADSEKVMDVDTLTNKLMTFSKSDVVTADGIYIDNAFLGAVEDGSEFLLYIDAILGNYRTETEHERVQFVKKVTVQQGVYPQSSVRPVHEIKTALESNESVPQTHKVADSETLASIAADNNTTVNDILKLNPLILSRSEAAQEEIPTVKAGEEIMVNRVELSLGIQVIRRETYYEDISFEVEYTDVSTMPESYTDVISYGKKGEREVVADITYVDGEKTDENILTREVVKEPVNERRRRGTMKPAQFITNATGGSSTSFMWPVAGGYVSAGLYGYRGHTGMDIACSAGTGIYASADGTVIAAYNYVNGAYGKRVDISHGGGVMTRYAHCSEVLVRAGQPVKQGQLIAKVGRTGNAYGNHCHFEVRINGVYMNPAEFVGNRFPGYK